MDGTMKRTQNLRVLRPLCAELKAEFKLAPVSMLPITDEELDYVWSFHVFSF